MLAKSEFYSLLIAQLESLICAEPDWLPNLANTAALLYEQLTDINWVGFYLFRQNELVLGPFQGKPACVRIPIGKGVCGTAAELRQTLVVPDVHHFPGHIACDAASRSEIVVPWLFNGDLIGVLDIDSPRLARFCSNDGKGLNKVIDLLNRYALPR